MPPMLQAGAWSGTVLPVLRSISNSYFSSSQQLQGKIELRSKHTLLVEIFALWHFATSQN